jgi:beta-phosphoglucomutase-like phosphatase (HAD superfamily)
VTHTAAHATTPQPAFAAVIIDIDGVVTDTAGLHVAAAAKCGWHEGSVRRRHTPGRSGDDDHDK